MQHDDLRGRGEIPHWRIDARLTDVTSYGAVGDGVTDDSAAFQRLIDARGDIYIPPGTYYLGTSLKLGRDGICIRGAGMGVTVLKTAAGAFAPSTSLTGPAYYITLSDFDVIPATTTSHGNSQMYLDAVGIDLTHISYSRVERVRVFQHQDGIKLATAASPFRPSYYNIIDSCYTWGGNTGIHLTGINNGGTRDGANANNVVSCAFRNANYGIYCAGGLNTFTGCKIESIAGSGYPSAPYGIYFDDPYALSNTVLGCYVEVPAASYAVHFGGSVSWDRDNQVIGGVYSVGGAATTPTGPALSVNPWHAAALDATRLIMRSANGTRYAVTVTDAGVLTTTAL